MFDAELRACILYDFKKPQMARSEEQSGKGGKKTSPSGVSKVTAEENYAWLVAGSALKIAASEAKGLETDVEGGVWKNSKMRKRRQI